MVPTWNYESVHLTGRITVHDDPEWVRNAVTMLTDTHEATQPHSWAVTDAPAKFVDGQLRGIVGLEFVVERVEGKAKLSQNRSDADREGAIAGLTETGTPRDTRHGEARARRDELKRFGTSSRITPSAMPLSPSGRRCRTHEPRLLVERCLRRDRLRMPHLVHAAHQARLCGVRPTAALGVAAEVERVRDQERDHSDQERDDQGFEHEARVIQ